MIWHAKKKSKKLRHTKKKILRKNSLLIFFFVILFSYVFLIRPVQKIRAQSIVLRASAQKVKDAFKENDLDKVKTELTAFDAEYAEFENDARWIYWTRFIPIVGIYTSDFRHGVLAGDSLLEAGKISVDAIAPYADLLGFKKGGANFANKSTDERIQTAVLTLDKVLGRVDEISVHIAEAQKHVDEINPNHYPKSLGKKEIRGRIQNLRSEFDDVATLFVNSKPFLKKLPDILGSKRQKTYIVLFQNDKELRPTGGFLTAYAIFYVNQGRLKVERSQDIYSLDDAIAVHPTAPSEILTYHKGVSKFYIRDSNLSPDFVKSVGLFDTLYQQSKNKIEYDGIIAMDTNVLVDTLRILGDTEVRGTVFSANTDPRCDCPQVIYKLLDEIDKPVGYVKDDRKGILGDLLFTIMQKALSSSPSQYWGPLSQDMFKNLNEKHILMYMTDSETQKSVESLNYAGRINAAPSDYLHINDTNFAGAKSNLFVQHSVASTTLFDDDAIRRDLVLEYKNPRRGSNCNLEAGQLCINATLRNWIRIYVPKGSKLITFQGSEKKVRTYDELGKTVFEGFFGVNPMGKSTIKVSYTLPSTIQKDGYSLMIQKQPGTAGHHYTLTVGNKQIPPFDLIKDYMYK